jgi:hypothetical protein
MAEITFFFPGGKMESYYTKDEKKRRDWGCMIVDDILFSGDNIIISKGDDQTTFSGLPYKLTRKRFGV